MAKLNLGRVAFVLRGEWAQGAYNKLDVVSYGTTGDSYVSRVDNNTALPTDDTKWLRLTNVGDSVAAANQAAQAANTAAESATAAAASGVRTDTDQSLTDAQKSTARGNIDAASVGEVSNLKSDVNDLENAFYDYTDYDFTQTFNSGYWNMGSATTNSDWIKTAYNSRKSYPAGLIFEVPSGKQLIVSLFATAQNSSAIEDIRFENGGSYELAASNYVSISLAYYPPQTITEDNQQALIDALTVKRRAGYNFVEKSGIDGEGQVMILSKINQAMNDLRALKNHVDESLSALVQIRSEKTPVEKTITLPSVGAHDRAFVRIGMHYGASQFTPDVNDVFFEGACEPDFSDVRFFDSNGKMLMAELSEPVNLDFFADPNIDGTLKTTSAGYLLKYNNGIFISTDNAVHWSLIDGTRNVTEHASDAYNRLSMYPVFVDEVDNIFAYAGGILYRLLASDNYATKTAVCDFSWVNSGGTTIYPDIQDHGFDTDGYGNFVFGNYSDGARHVDIWTSHDSGLTWTKTLTSTGEEYQHVHHVQGDHYSGKLYVTIDDGASLLKGGRVLVSDDGGDTWEDITDPIFATGVKGKDFYPNYCGDGYRLGGAESYLMGNATIYRSTDDVHLDAVVGGIAGCRSIVDFGTDDILICGTQSPKYVAQNNILVSYDRGKTWKNVMTFFQQNGNGAGGGYKYSLFGVQLPGETEPCVLMPKDYGSVPSYRVYKGGSHYYREARVLLENTTDATITLTAKTGYMMEYPTKSLRREIDDHLVYEIPLNEGYGNHVHDSLGNIAAITGEDYEWERGIIDPVRFADLAGSNVPEPFMPSCGLFIGKGTALNMGKIAALNFSKSYTISLWLNTHSAWLNPDVYNNRPTFYSWLRAGNIMFYRAQANGRIGYALQTLDSASMVSSIPRSAIQNTDPTYVYANQYFHFVITVDSDRKLNFYMNGCPTSGTRDDYQLDTATWQNLSEGDFVITSGSKEPLGYISDIKIFDKALSAEEVMGLYRGDGYFA